MIMIVNKKGIWNVENIYESSAMNIHYHSNLGDYDNRSYTFTPSTENNSCMRDIIVHGGLYPYNELMHVRFKVKWNGFDTSNTAGDFNIFFQGCYVISDGTTNWSTPLGSSANSHKNLRTLVLSSASGEYVYDYTFPNMNTTTSEGVRCDYSNGTARIIFSDIIVVPEKYYVRSTPPEDNFTALHIGTDYISAGEIIEF